MATLLKVLNNLADIKSAGGVALRLGTQGGVENANGRLRRWLPRHLDIDRTSDQEIQEVVLTNTTPRKCLGFKTPFQALLAELGKDVQSASLNLVALRSGIQARARISLPSERGGPSSKSQELSLRHLEPRNRLLQRTSQHVQFLIA
jgi:hypothetical protein